MYLTWTIRPDSCWKWPQEKSSLFWISATFQLSDTMSMLRSSLIPLLLQKQWHIWSMAEECLRIALAVTSYLSFIEAASKPLCFRNKNHHMKGLIYWWMQEIVDFPNRWLNCVCARLPEYKSANRELCRAVTSSSLLLETLMEVIDRAPYALAYMLVTQKLGIMKASSLMYVAIMGRDMRNNVNPLSHIKPHLT